MFNCIDNHGLSLTIKLVNFFQSIVIETFYWEIHFCAFQSSTCYFSSDLSNLDVVEEVVVVQRSVVEYINKHHILIDEAAVDARLVK